EQGDGTAVSLGFRQDGHSVSETMHDRDRREFHRLIQTACLTFYQRPGSFNTASGLESQWRTKPRPRTRTMVTRKSWTPWPIGWRRRWNGLAGIWKRPDQGGG